MWSAVTFTHPNPWKMLALGLLYGIVGADQVAPLSVLLDRYIAADALLLAVRYAVHTA